MNKKILLLTMIPFLCSCNNFDYKKEKCLIYEFAISKIETPYTDKEMKNLIINDGWHFEKFEYSKSKHGYGGCWCSKERYNWISIGDDTYCYFIQRQNEIMEIKL